MATVGLGPQCCGMVRDRASSAMRERVGKNSALLHQHHPQIPCALASKVTGPVLLHPPTLRWTITWPSVVANKRHRHHHSLSYVRTTDPLMGLSRCMGMSIEMTLGSWLHMPLKYAGCSETAKPEDTTKVPDSGTDCMCPHGSQASYGPKQQHGPQTPNMASSGTMNHDDPSKRSNQESKLFLISGLQHCPDPRGTCCGAVGLGTVSASAYPPAAVYHPTDPMGK